jgi:predicted nucleotidyltransferase
MDTRKEMIKKLLHHYKVDDQVLGVILVGSLAKDYEDEYSDIDLELVVTENRYDELERNAQRIIHTEKYDLIFTTIDRLQKVKESERDEDHWLYKDCPLLLDKTGKLAEILKEIAKYDQNSRIERLKRYYLAYWENTLYSTGCLRHKNKLSARIYAAIAIQELIRLLFNFNYQWAPKLQWAFKELPSLQRKPINLEAQIENILTKPDVDKQSKLWNETAKLLREEKYVWVDRPEEICNTTYR